jgi:hypothetical protein
MQFAETVQRNFKFLVVRGFRLVRADPTFVRFESPWLFINLYHGRRSYEIGLELGQIGRPEDEDQPYPMSALLEAVGSSDAKNYLNYTARNMDAVDAGVARLAKLFNQNITEEFLARRDLFNLLKQQRKSRADSFALKTNLEQARSIVEPAWRTKDYKKVVEILLPLSEHLTASERKKLEYAKRMTLN